MAITIIKHPPAMVLSRNPVLFELETDNRFAVLGQRNIMEMTFSQGQNVGASFKLTWGINDFTFYFNSELGNTGQQLPSFVSGALSDWLDQVASELNNHYYLSREYIVERIGADKIRFTSSAIISQEIVFINQTLSGVTGSIIQIGIGQELRKNFSLLLELWMEREDRTGFDRYSQSVVEVDENGRALWDVQQYLTSIILKDGPILPDLYTGGLVVDNRSVRRFYISYAEMYGEPQVIYRVRHSSSIVALLGGFNDENITRQLPGYFYKDSFLSWIDGDRIWRVHNKQPVFASIINFNEDYTGIKVKCRIYYTDYLEQVIELFTVPNWGKYSKLVVPIGLIDKLSQYHADKVIRRVAVWIESDGAVVSSFLQLSIDNEIRPAMMTLLYLNSLGCFQTLYTYGKRTWGYDIDKTAEAFQSGFEVNVLNHSFRELGLKSRNSVKLNSGFFPFLEIRRFRDYILSSYKFLQIDGKYCPVVLDSNSIEESTDFENLKAITFSLQYSNEDQFWGE